MSTVERRIAVSAIIAVIALVLASLTGVAVWSALTPQQKSAGPSNPLSGTTFYRDPDSSAAKAAAADPSGDLDPITNEPAAIWLLPEQYPTATVGGRVAAVMKAASAKDEVPVFVVYGIPNRDCGNQSAGGTATSTDYQAWVAAIAKGLKGGRSVVILEPDALALSTQCGDVDERVAELRTAIATLAPTGATVYLDAGHSTWQPVGTIVQLLGAVGLGSIRGFSTNVSNFNTTADELAYDEQISSRLGGAHFVIDTSRSGNGPAPDAAFCNPPGRKLGEPPRVVTDGTPLDATLWVKNPGESDGSCNGGPPAGQWWQAGALALIAGTG